MMTRRQLQIYALLGAGMSNAQICAQLGIANGACKVHASNIYRAIGVSNRTQAAIVYQQQRRAA